MKITIESTTQMVMLDLDNATVPARVWDGVTEDGVRVQCLITRIAVHKYDDNSQFERELNEHPPKEPTGVRAFPLRMIL